MVQIDAGNVLSAAQQLELTKLAVVSQLVAVVLMFTVTVSALVMFGRKSTRHASERQKQNTEWQDTVKGVAKEFTAEFLPLVREIGKVTLAVSSLQRDVAGSVEGMSASVSDLATLVSQLVAASNKMRHWVDGSERIPASRYEELFRRESDTALRMDRLEIALGEVKASVMSLARRVAASRSLSPRDRRTIRQLIGSAQGLVAKFGGQIEAMKEVRHEASESDLPAGGGAAGDFDGGRAGAGTGLDTAGAQHGRGAGGDTGAAPLPRTGERP